MNAPRSCTQVDNYDHTVASPQKHCLERRTAGAANTLVVCIVLFMARLSSIWRCSTISFASKFKLYKSLITSTLLYGCETWTLLADSEKRIQAFETKCLWELLHISYLEHKTNDWMRSNINFCCLLYTSPAWSTRPTTWCRTRSTSLWIHRNLFCNCWETETGMVRACHTPRQPLLNHPSGHLGGWATWLVEEMLRGQVDIPVHARTVQKSLL